MPGVRECTVCARRMYSTSLKNKQCSVRTCRGRTVLVSDTERARYIYSIDGARKQGEFW